MYLVFKLPKRCQEPFFGLLLFLSGKRFLTPFTLVNGYSGLTNF